MTLCTARRRFLHLAARRGLWAGGLATAGSAVPAAAFAAPGAVAAPAGARQLAFAHTHTGERLQLVYAIGDRYLSDALTALDRLLRDHYSGEVGRIDPALFDQLHRLQQVLGATGPLEVISGFRSGATNERLRSTRGGGVARRSLHLDGRAIDIRLPGVPLTDLRDAARSLKSGGVGFYPQDRFVHVDTGPVRAW